jgi:hypothetical protein
MNRNEELVEEQFDKDILVAKYTNFKESVKQDLIKIIGTSIISDKGDSR